MSKSNVWRSRFWKIGFACVLLASVNVVTVTILAVFGVGTHGAMAVSLLRGIAWGVVGIGFLSISRA